MFCCQNNFLKHSCDFITHLLTNLQGPSSLPQFAFQKKEMKIVKLYQQFLYCLWFHNVVWGALLLLEGGYKAHNMAH